MIVEFIGLPGVGKSYLCSNLKKILGQDDNADEYYVSRPVDSVPKWKAFPEKLLFAALFSVSSPRRATQIVQITRKGMLGNSRSVIPKIVNLLFELYRNQINKERFYIGEQGVLQAVWSLTLRINPRLLDELIELVDPWLPDVVIFVKADDQVHIRRLYERSNGRSYYDKMEPNELTKEISSGRDLLYKIVEIWRQKSPPSAKLFDIINETDSANQSLHPILNFIPTQIQETATDCV